MKKSYKNNHKKLNKKTFKKGGANVVTRIASYAKNNKKLGEQALRLIKHLPEGQKLIKEYNTSIFPGKIYEKAIELFLNNQKLISTSTAKTAPTAQKAVTTAKTASTTEVISNNDSIFGTLGITGVLASSFLLSDNHGFKKENQKRNEPSFFQKISKSFGDMTRDNYNKSKKFN